MASSSHDKGKKPMEAESLVPPLITSRKGQNQASAKENLAEKMTLNGGVQSGKLEKKERRSRKQKVEMEKLKAIQCGVQANIASLSSSSLVATIVGDPVEAKEVRKRIKFDWKFLIGGFQLVPLANKWFELKFDLSEDRDNVWAKRPFHVASQLMLVRPWSLAFDPWTESISLLDLWIRIPGLPVKYVSNSILTSIIEDNEIGKVLRVAAFSSKGARLRYPRVCISTDLTLIKKKRVSMLNEKGELESYPIWFEDFPEGCGSCGLLDHVFDDCPSRRLCNASLNGVLGSDTEAAPAADDAADPNVGDGAWARVAARRAPTPAPPTFGHPKAELWKSFGKNVVISSDSSSDNSSSISVEISSTKADHVVVDEEVNSPTAVEQPSPTTTLAVPPNDANTFVSEEDLLDPEYLDIDDDAMDYEEDPGLLDGCGGIPADMTQADFDAMLGNIPASAKFVLPNLSNPARQTNSSTTLQVAPAALPMVVQESMRPGTPSKSESSKNKRKYEEEEGEAVSSKLMGSDSKRGNNGK